MISMSRKGLAALSIGTIMWGLVALSTPAAAQQNFLGAIDFAGYNFAPADWVKCDGQILPISQFQALFSLLGSNFGGDGRSTFGLPDMRGRSPIHDGESAGPGLTHRPLGKKDGVESVTLSVDEIPSHNHTLRGTTSTGNQVVPTGNTLADDAPDLLYRSEAPNTTMHANAIGATQSGPHENMAPFLTINCIIALTGTFPSRN